MPRRCCASSNVQETTIDYQVTIAFQGADRTSVATATRDELAPGDTDVLTVVSNQTFTDTPVCTIQKVVRYESGG